MNITLDLLKLVADKLREFAERPRLDTSEQDTFLDAADALDDARDLLEELA